MPGTQFGVLTLERGRKGGLTMRERKPQKGGGSKDRRGTKELHWRGRRCNNGSDLRCEKIGYREKKIKRKGKKKKYNTE